MITVGYLHKYASNILIQLNAKTESKRYTSYKASLHLKRILLKNGFLKRSLKIAGIAGDLFFKSYLVVLVLVKLALRGWFGILVNF